VFNIGPAEIMVILLIALLVFGPKRLPEIGKTVGKGLREFRKASQDIKDELSASMSDEDDEAGASPPDSKPANLEASPPNPNGGSGASTGPQVPGGAVPGS
jgi:sec-independent protein translocase protein TatA